MKLILILVVIVILYFIITQIKVVHINKLPEKQKIELDNKLKLKSILSPNYVKYQPNDQIEKNPNKKQYQNQDIHKEHFIQLENHNEIDNKFLTAGNLINIIKTEYLDDQYKFNIANLPVTTYHPNRDTKKMDKKYLKHIKNNIKEWNNILREYTQNKISVRDIIPILIMKTENEFIIKVQVQLIYLNKTLHLQLMYYGQIEKLDDFLNYGSDIYILQLIDISPMSKKEYNMFKEKEPDNYLPFMTMNEQMEYVDKINKMHAEEANY